MELKSSGLACGSTGAAGETVSSFLASCAGDGVVAPLSGTAASVLAAAGGAATGADAATGAEAVTGGAASLADGGVSEALGAAISSVVGGSSLREAAAETGAVTGVAETAWGLGAGEASACLPGRGGTAGAADRALFCARSGALAQTSTVAPSRRRLAVRIVNLFVDRKRASS